jgi:excisionase family DNA binding protein
MRKSKSNFAGESLKLRAETQFFYSYAEAARALGVSPDTVRRLCRNRELRRVRLGHRIVRIPASELQRLAQLAA